MNPVTKKRKKVLIDAAFQLKLSGAFAGLLFFYLVVFFSLAMLAPVIPGVFRGSKGDLLLEIGEQVELLLQVGVVPVILTFVAVFLHGLLVMFKIAGPNYRFKQVLHDVSRLRIARGVAIREGDLLQDVASEMDGALIHLHDHVLELKQVVLDMDSSSEPSRCVALGRIEALLDEVTLTTRAPAREPLTLQPKTRSEAELEPLST